MFVAVRFYRYNIVLEVFGTFGTCFRSEDMASTQRIRVFTYPRVSYIERCLTVALFIVTTDKYFVNFKALKNIYILKFLLYRQILEIGTYW